MRRTSRIFYSYDVKKLMLDRSLTTGSFVADVAAAQLSDQLHAQSYGAAGYCPSSALLQFDFATNSAGQETLS
jgi:hypothetical protein